MKRLYANNCRTTLASAAASSDTTLTLASGAGWPSPSSGEANYATLDDGAGHVEIVEVTARSGATLTVTRAQQGTTARTWAIGTTVDLRWTAEDGASRVWTGSAPALSVDGDIAVDSVTGVLWYRLGGSTLRAARAPGAGTTITDGLAIFDGSSGGQLKAQTAWRVVSNARLEPTSSACELALPTLPVLTPTAGTAGRVWLDTATGELVSDDGAALLRYAPGGGTVDLQSAYVGGADLDVDDLDLTITLSAADLRIDGPGSVLFGVGAELDQWWLATTGSIEIVAGDGYEVTVTGAFSVAADTAAITADSVTITSTSPVSLVGGLEVDGSLVDLGGDLTTVGTVEVSAFGASLVDDADASAARTTLGLGALATLATVGTSQIDAAAVTYARIQNVTDERLLGRYDGSSGAPRELTPEEVRELLGEAAARVIDYTSSGTVSLPSGCTGNEWCRATLRAPGGPGGSGRRSATGVQASGGGGGGAGGLAVWEGVLSDLVSLTLTLGALGTPGAAVGDSTDGQDGVTGTDSSLGSIMYAVAGIRGRGGTSSAGGAGGSASLPLPSPNGTGGAGGSGNANAGGTEAGGGGGGINASNTVNGAREGGRSLSGSAGGIGGTNAGDDGADGDALGSGGGGGRGSTTGDAGDGGDGVGPGAGGGGGGGGRNGYGGGGAGQGGPAHFRIVVYT